jgi:hypothetical protein
VSATCRDVLPLSAPAIYNSHDPASYEYCLPAPTSVNSNSAETLQHSTRTASAVANSVLPPATKATLCLPTSAEDWKLADSFFQTTLVPESMSLSSPQQMSSVLCEGIYSYFASTYGTKTAATRRVKKRPLHSRALKEVERQKKDAKRELRLARKSGSPADVVHSLATHFISLVRAHSKLKKASNARLITREVKAARERCHRDFRQCAREILDGGLDRVEPSFGDEAATSFFSGVYHSDPRIFVQPEWMPTPSPPEVELDCSQFSVSELARVIKRMKAQSAPSPFDRVGYIIFKKCPSLLPALVKLFNICWAQSTIPGEWKCAAIKLIPKSSASEDTTNPGNFRPIALTPCVGKLFSSLLRNRWLRYMVTNKYLDSSLQKAFMPTVPGCTEHHQKLSSILAEAHSNHKSVAVSWLDLANAYGSVHHSLIDFSLRHYHAPPQFLSTVQALYTGLHAKVITAEWETPVISLQKGVYQGDPLSVVIFNTVMNTLLDTVSLRTDLGYRFSNSRRRVNILQYADDTCLIANSPASCQYLLDTTSNWLQWSGMSAKVPKCQCLSLQGSSGKLADPHLTLDGMPIPFSTGPVRFLGMEVQVPKNSSAAREAVLSRLQEMLQAIDKSLLTRKQKLLLYSGGVCPRLSWPLLIQEFPTTWMERQVDSLVTGYLKRWSGLGKSANTALLYLPRLLGGLNLPSPSTLHKRLQVSRQCQLLTSQDSCVRFLAERGLKNELSLARKQFRPAVEAREALKISPGCSRKALTKSAKALVSEEVNSSRLDNLQGLERQGQLSRCTSPSCAPIWSRAVLALPEDQLKFAINAAVDVLPHNSNLYLWRKRKDSSCPLCHENQSLLHVLNNCSVARNYRRYNVRHDSILSVITETVSRNIPPTTSMTADISDTYEFPHHIIPTDLRPDLVWWDEAHKSITLVELTVCFETNFEEAARRKSVKYLHLVEQAKAREYR